MANSYNGSKARLERELDKTYFELFSECIHPTGRYQELVEKVNDLQFALNGRKTKHDK